MDLDEGVIHITDQIVAVAFEPYEDTPKNDRIRDISLDQDTLELLRWWRKAQEAERTEWEDKRRENPKKCGPYVDSGRVFTREDGSAYHPQFFSDHFERLYKKAGLPPVRLHDLRHGSASLALLAGVHIKVAQQRLGHSSIKVTADIYTSIAEEVEREAAEATLAVVPRSRKKKLPADEPPLEAAEEDDPEDEKADEKTDDEGSDGPGPSLPTRLPDGPSQRCPNMARIAHAEGPP